MNFRYQAVLFDLLTALLDSWTLWNRVAGGAEAGRRWRARYLELTYGCGAYEPYEGLVEQAACDTGLTHEHARTLEAQWDTLTPWDDARATLRALAVHHRLGVVTNCSETLGRRAAACLGVPLDVLVTSARAGFYKPDPRPYRLALDELGLEPQQVLYCAGSGFDLFGTARVGLDAYWHNRAGLALPAGAPAPRMEARTLCGLVALARSGAVGDAMPQRR